MFTTEGYRQLQFISLGYPGFNVQNIAVHLLISAAKKFELSVFACHKDIKMLTSL